MKWAREFHDATIEFEMKTENCQRVVFTLNGDGHIFRVTLADERADAPAGKSRVPTRIIAWATKSSKQNKGDTIKPEYMPDLPAVNEKWVPVQLTVKGNRAMLTIGDFQTEINHTALERDKNMVMLTFAHGELSVRNFRMNSSGTSAVKPASYAKTSVFKKGKQNRIQRENAKPGTRDWLLTQNYDTAEPTTQHPQTQIKGIIQS